MAKKHTFVRVQRFHRYSDDYSDICTCESEEVLVDIDRYVGFNLTRKGRTGRVIDGFMTVYFDTHVPDLQRMIIDMASFERLKQFVKEV